MGGGREEGRVRGACHAAQSSCQVCQLASHTHHGAKAIDVIAAVLLTQQLHHLLQVVGNVSSLHTGYRLWKGIEGICTTSSQLIACIYIHARYLNTALPAPDMQSVMALQCVWKSSGLLGCGLNYRRDRLNMKRIRVQGLPYFI